MSELTNMIGARMKGYREQAKLSREDLGDLAGLHPTYIGQIERGEKNATLESIAKIARALNISLETLFKGISTGSDSSTIAVSCYNLIQAQPLDDQKKLYEILNKVVSYKSL